MEKQLEVFQLEIYKLYNTDTDDVTKANDIFSLIVNRAVGFNHLKFPSVVLDAYVEDNRSLLLYKIVGIIGTLTDLNFYVNTKTYLDLYKGSNCEYISVLGDRCYPSRIAEPVENELVWTDQDIEPGAIDRVIPVLRGVPEEIIDFIVVTLYKGE